MAERLNDLGSDVVLFDQDGRSRLTVQKKVQTGHG